MKLVDEEFAEDSQDANTEYTFFYYTAKENADNKTTGDQKVPILILKFREEEDGTVYAGGFNSEPMLLRSKF